MRTQDEIVTRLHATEVRDVFGFERELLAVYLDAAHVRPFCRADADLSDWTALPLTRAAVLEAMRDYMAFAWGKVQDHRGISAGRSVQKMAAWCWLLGDDEAVAFAENDAHYPQYGAPILAFLSERFGFPIPDDDDIQRMRRGERCSATYDCGCAV